MELKDVLIRPLVTEKSTSGLGSEQAFAFEVAVTANKIQIKKAVEAYYDVEVDDVRTLIVRGKVRRFGRRLGKRKNWKKAYVTLAEGHTIPLFEA